MKITKQWVDANEAIHHLFDVKREELIGKSNQELASMFPQFKDIFEDWIVSDEETWEKETITEFEWEFRNKDGVHDLLAKTDLHPSYLELEIIESSMQTPQLTIPILKEIKKLGVSLSIDDFGTGYSSLAYLRDFPIDRSFVEEMSTSGGAIVEMIINIATYLHVSVVAEGIETVDQLRYLKNYYTSKK